ncbi:hypothetical protein V1521DRAFT_433287 [Lipomyces starkeyi]
MSPLWYGTLPVFCAHRSSWLVVLSFVVSRLSFALSIFSSSFVASYYSAFRGFESTGLEMSTLALVRVCGLQYGFSQVTLRVFCDANLMTQSEKRRILGQPNVYCYYLLFIPACPSKN